MWITFPNGGNYKKDFLIFVVDMKPLILISNDDGYLAKGVRFLAETLRPLAQIIVVAPAEGRSGMACACTFREPVYRALIESEEGLEIYSCTGTPVDCVKLAIAQICPRKPDLIVGGINHGDNSAINAHYSGTMGVVLEGCMKGIPSVAFSLASHDVDADFTPMVPYIRRIVSYILENGLPTGSCLNVNCPDRAEYKGMRICHMANGLWENEFERRDHPRGGDYFWLTGSFRLTENQDDCADKKAMDEGYVAVTPIHLDLTDYALKSRLERELSE
ncbi:MAG: 5'/3'-nucleotidase SurE [Bacteroidaceae bacterium]|nr:5'/3'-nucleotidase SurE [Bacteroidaceae bacterium]